VPLPWTPPKAVEEKHVLVNVRDDIDIRLGQYDHLGRCGEYKRGRKLNPDMDIDLRAGRKR
jgi:hypothetical protein